MKGNTLEHPQIVFLCHDPITASGRSAHFPGSEEVNGYKWNKIRDIVVIVKTVLYFYGHN